MTILDRNSGTFSTTTSVTVTRSTGSFGTNTVLVVAIFGNTVFNTPGTMTQRTSSVLNMGLYSYDKVGAGEISLPFTATSSGSGAWFCWELTNGSTWVNGQASQVATSETSYATPSVTPTLGDRHLLAVAGGLGNGNARNVASFSNSFAEWADLQATVQDWPFAAAADLNVTANGVASYSTTGTFSGVTSSGAGGITLAYADGGAAAPADVRRPARRGPNFRR